jgi:hypothetical protein
MDLTKVNENVIPKMSNIYQNNLSYTTIRGLSMVSLVIDGKERVCLAQISNSLLKKFTYNEIHNRRVALGINCIQCTPLQLDILRSTGAMPVSSRRCGMITKREAERLVKSFLDDNKPLTLPDNFAFDVQHKCGFGCRGIFFPSRYNSSRAKCIRCYYCFAFFSPNKFIFHMHETSNSKYVKPETANFNSWRRHISLINDSGNDDLSSAWEDVKSIFNGGKRKRNQHSPVSSQYCDEDSDLDCSLNDSNNDLNGGSAVGKISQQKSVDNSLIKSSNINEKLNDEEDDFEETNESENISYENNNNKQEDKINHSNHINNTNINNKFDLNEQILKLPFLNPFLSASAAFNFTQILPELFGLSNSSLLLGQNLNRTDSDFFRHKLLSSQNCLKSSLDRSNSCTSSGSNSKHKKFDYTNICSSLFGNQASLNPNIEHIHKLAKSRHDKYEQDQGHQDQQENEDEEFMTRIADEDNDENNNNIVSNEGDDESRNDQNDVKRYLDSQPSAFRPPKSKPKNFFSLVDHI